MHHYDTHQYCNSPSNQPLDSAFQPPAGATHSVRSRAAVFERPGAAPVGTQAWPGAAGRPLWSRLPSRASPKRRRRKTSSWLPVSTGIRNARAACDAGVPTSPLRHLQAEPDIEPCTRGQPAVEAVGTLARLAGAGRVRLSGDRLDDREALADRSAAWRLLRLRLCERGAAYGSGSQQIGVRLPARSLDHRDGRPVRSIRGRGPPSSGPPSPTPVSLANRPSQARESVPLPDAPASPAWQLSNRSDRFPHSGAAVAVVRPTRAARTPALSSTAAARAAVRLRRSALRRTAR